MPKSESIQVLSRALHILDVLSRQDSPRTLAEIAAKAGLPKSTTHRLLQALAADEFVSVHSLGRYAVGRAMICVGSRSLRGGLLTQADADAKQLRDLTDHTVYLTVLHRLEVVYIGKYPGALMPKTDLGTGPAPFSAPGRAMLSQMPWAEVEDLIKAHGLTPKTPYSNNDLARLRAELEETRARGYAFSVNEYAVGVSSLGAPIFDYTGKCTAGLGLSVVLPGDDVDVHGYAPLLLETAARISERMGHVAARAE